MQFPESKPFFRVVFFCETWIQALQVYHELLQLQDLQRQLQQMDNTAAQAWSFGVATQQKAMMKDGTSISVRGLGLVMFDGYI